MEMKRRQIQDTKKLDSREQVSHRLRGIVGISKSEIDS
jgi:hypothetical protein